MKITLRNFALLFTFLMFSTSSFAQFQLGFKTGIQRAGVTSDLNILGYNPLKKLKAPQIGVVANIGLGEHFSLQPELNYTPRGFKIKEGIDLDIINIPVNLGAILVTKINYLNLPLMAKYKFGTGKVRGFVMAGPEVAYALNGSFKTKAKVLVEFTLVDEPINLDKLGMERFDAGATIGGGFAVDTGSGEFFMDARYTRSFTNMVEVPVIDIPVKSKGMQLNAGYLWKF